MIQIFKRNEGKLFEIDEPEIGCWVHLCDPEQNEIDRVVEFFGVEEEFVKAALDEEESARIDRNDDQMLVLVDIPSVQADGRTFMYTTIPLGIIDCEKGIVTVCLKESNIIDDFVDGRVRGFSSNKKTRFLLQILYRNAGKFLQYLKQIDKASSVVEEELHKSMKNRELIQMLKLEKSLVYFSTSLKNNEVVMEKLLRTEMIKKWPEDRELLEDVIIEYKQAIDMCTIFRDILGGTMDAFASVISNNLNIVMKFLAAMTIVLAIPQVIFGLWGMNVRVPFENNPAGFFVIIGISVLISVLVGLWMWRKRMF